MFKRKHAISFHWEKTRQRQERRFDHEIISFAAAPSASANRQNATLQRLEEVVEVTAIQRGCRTVAAVIASWLWQLVAELAVGHLHHSAFGEFVQKRAQFIVA